MDLIKLQESIGGTDIYLLDQILKRRYSIEDRILDAGCGKGRNLKWFYKNNYAIYGVDQNKENIDYVKQKFNKKSPYFSVQNLEELNYEDASFNHIICNAVLHFAKDTTHFLAMFSELVRVVKSNGTIFIRTATIEGIKDKTELISEGVYKLPDKTTRYLLTKALLNQIQQQFDVELIEPFKYVNVDDLRCMATLVFKKVK